tara:strand:- start:201 stop:461 length:261 start_codon:yes stop_codon:yes gene_type:complete
VGELDEVEEEEEEEGSFVVFTFTFTFTSTSRLVEERLFESDLLECSDLPIVPELFLLPGICEMFSQGGGTLFKLLIGVDIFLFVIL